MKLLTLSCQHCGAPLETPLRTKRLKCVFCGAWLQIQWIGSAASTVAETESVSPFPAEISAKQQKAARRIARLDRKWVEYRECWRDRRHSGQLKMPSQAWPILGGAVVVMYSAGFAIVAGAAALGHNVIGLTPQLGPVMFPWAVLPFLAMCVAFAGLVSTRNRLVSGDRFFRQQRRFRVKRRRLLAKYHAGQIPGERSLVES